MKKCVFAGIFGLMAMGAWATSFSYQGVLRDAQGGEVSNRQPTITFRLYDSATGANALWARQYPVTLDANGLFTLELTDAAGSEAGVSSTLDNVLAAHGSANLFIGLEVQGSSGEIRPRQKLLPVPVAGFAQDVNTARGDFTVNGKATVTGELDVSGGIKVQGTSRFESLETGAGATLGGDIKTTGTLTAQGGIVLSNTATIKTADDRELIPRGTIWMWYGDANNIPTGWALCDGTNGTPDMRGRFPVGTGRREGSSVSYDKGDQGGEDKHKLTIDEMPAHTHSYNFNGADLVASWKNENRFYNQSNHYDNDNARNTNSAGGNQEHENRPPYLALHFIMKL